MSGPFNENEVTYLILPIDVEDKTDTFCIGMQFDASLPEAA